LREVCPKEAIWHFSPFVFTGLHRYAWRFLRRFQVDWQVILIAAPIVLELIRQFLGMRFRSSNFLFYLGTGTPWMCQNRAQAAGAGTAAARRANSSVGQSDQPSFSVQYAEFDCIAHPIAAGNRADADRQAVGTASASLEES
jgi:hypothetical protein